MAKDSKRAADLMILAALSCGATAEAAAAKAGVSARTVRRRLREPAFVRKLNRKRTEMQMRIADQLTAAGTEAVRTMVQLMQASTPHNVRMTASRSIVELGAKMREAADLANRITDLEQRFAEQKGKAR